MNGKLTARRLVTIVGLIVGAELKGDSDKAHYLVDDGTAVISCLHSLRKPARFAEPKTSHGPYPSTSAAGAHTHHVDVIQVGQLVRVAGQVQERWARREVVVEEIEPLSDANKEHEHWTSVFEARSLRRSLPSRRSTPLATDIASVLHGSWRDVDVDDDRDDEHSIASSSRSSCASSDVDVDSAVSALPSPSQLKRKHLTPDRFLFYLKAHIYRASGRPEGREGVRSALVEEVCDDDRTPVVSRVLRFRTGDDAGHDGAPSTARHQHAPPSFASLCEDLDRPPPVIPLRSLRREPTLRQLARRVVRRMLEDDDKDHRARSLTTPLRARERKRARTNAGRTTTATERTDLSLATNGADAFRLRARIDDDPARAGGGTGRRTHEPNRRERSFAEARRLFAWAIRSLSRDGFVVLAPHPVPRSMAASEQGQTRGVHPLVRSARTKSVVAAPVVVLPSTSCFSSTSYSPPPSHRPRSSSSSDVSPSDTSVRTSSAYRSGARKRVRSESDGEEWERGVEEEAFQLVTPSLLRPVLLRVVSQEFQRLLREAARKGLKRSQKPRGVSTDQVAAALKAGDERWRCVPKALIEEALMKMDKADDLQQIGRGVWQIV